MHRRAAVTLTSLVVLFASHARQEVSGGQQVLGRVKCVVNVHTPDVVQGYTWGWGGGVYVVFVGSRYMK